MKLSFSQRNLLALALFILVIGTLFALSNNHRDVPFLSDVPSIPSGTLSAASTTITVILAETQEEHARGLSGREELDADMGMLFIFDHPDRYGFWMPDMHFPIDIIWIDADWRIVDISANVPPDSYPKLFNPRAPAQYVLEVNAGNAAASDWEIGTQFVFTR